MRSPQAHQWNPTLLSRKPTQPLEWRYRSSHHYDFFFSPFRVKGHALFKTDISELREASFTLSSSSSSSRECALKKTLFCKVALGDVTKATSTFARHTLSSVLAPPTVAIAVGSRSELLKTDLVSSRSSSLCTRKQQVMHYNNQQTSSSSESIFQHTKSYKHEIASTKYILQQCIFSLFPA